MKAAVCYEFGKPLAIEDVTLDPPKYGEVMVRFTATAICHSDVHLIRGEWSGNLPVIAGHESAGTVEAIGEGVKRVQPGDRVVISLLRCCGRCEYCLTGLPYFCDATYALSTESRIRSARGQPISQGIRVAGFAEYGVVNESQLVGIPNDMNPEAAALLGCGVITGFGAAVNTAQIKPGSSVVVIGVGGVGLNSIQGAALAGAGRVIAVDLLENKLKAARQFGATDTVNAREHDAVEAVRALTGSRGADYALVTVGSSAAINQALRMIRKAGTVVIVGIPPDATELSLSVGSFVVDGRHLMGSFMGSTRLQVDVPRLIEHYRRGRIKLDELITGRYPLEQINEAIESMERGEALRNVIVF